LKTSFIAHGRTGGEGGGRREDTSAPQEEGEHEKSDVGRYPTIALVRMEFLSTFAERTKNNIARILFFSTSAYALIDLRCTLDENLIQ